MRKWNSVSTALFGTCLLAVSLNAQAVLMYSITNGVTTTTIDPIADAQSASDYYSYGTPYGSSGDPDFGTQSNVGFFWLYEETGSGEISLGMIFDTVSDGSGGNVTLTTSGMPASATVSVEDDGPDINPANLINGTESWNWFGCCTDGAVISGLGGDWGIDIDLVSSSGIDNWIFLNGPSTSEPSQLSLDMSQTLAITAEGDGEPVPVPEPSIMALFGLGLVGIGITRRRSKA